MLNWLLSAPTRLDWFIVLMVVIGVVWLLTTPIGMKIYMRWVAKKTKKAMAGILEELFEIEDTEDEAD